MLAMALALNVANANSIYVVHAGLAPPPCVCVLLPGPSPSGAIGSINIFGALGICTLVQSTGGARIGLTVQLTWHLGLWAVEWGVWPRALARNTFFALMENTLSTRRFPEMGMTFVNGNIVPNCPTDIVVPMMYLPSGSTPFRRAGAVSHCNPLAFLTMVFGDNLKYASALANEGPRHMQMIDVSRGCARERMIIECALPSLSLA